MNLLVSPHAEIVWTQVADSFGRDRTETVRGIDMSCVQFVALSIGHVLCVN